MLNKAGISLENKVVLLTEAPLNPKSNREKTLSIMMDDFKV